MYSNKKNVLHLIALLKAFGIKHIIVCPGSRNSPLSHSFANDSFFNCHTVVDERSAGFYALGVIQNEKGPVAVCCTSGTAVLNLAPAVAEAYYQELPLIVITADRPQAWIGQMDGQTLPQPGVFNNLVKKSIQLPEIHNKEDEWYCNRLVNEALLEIEYPDWKPIHINIPISEPLFEYTIEELPSVRRIKRHTIGIEDFDFSPFEERFLNYKKKMIIIGQYPPESILHEALESLTYKHDCVIISELLSNIKPMDSIINFDAMLYALPKDRWEECAPDLLITMGGHIISKRLKKFIRKHPPKEHWHISTSGEVIDLYQCLTDVIQTYPFSFISYFALLDSNKASQKKQYLTLWNSLQFTLCEPEVWVYSDMFVVKTLLDSIPTGSSLHLANSSGIRLAHLFPLYNKNIHIFSNRGTNGIDGSVSTAVGYAAVSNRLTFLLTGDLAFFYDMNGLWNDQLSKNLRICLNNNGGGEIFHSIPGLNESNALDYISAPHKTNAKGWAETMGFIYLPVSNNKELAENLYTFVNMKSDKPILMEAFTSMKENIRILHDFYHALKNN